MPVSCCHCCRVTVLNDSDQLFSRTSSSCSRRFSSSPKSDAATTREAHDEGRTLRTICQAGKVEKSLLFRKSTSLLKNSVEPLNMGMYFTFVYLRRESCNIFGFVNNEMSAKKNIRVSVWNPVVVYIRIIWDLLVCSSSSCTPVSITNHKLWIKAPPPSIK